MIYASSCMQRSIAFSSTKADNLALTEASNTVQWLRIVLEELKVPQKSTTICQENIAAINSAKLKSSYALHVSQTYRREALLHKRLNRQWLNYNWDNSYVTNTSESAHQATCISRIPPSSSQYRFAGPPQAAAGTPLPLRIVHPGKPMCGECIS